jgi:heterotetrameric sarcosine oxidase gamma subunit
VADLTASTPFADLLPLAIGGVTLTAADPGRLTVLTPFDRDAAGAALDSAHGLTLPEPNRTTGKDGNRCLWFGLRDVLLMGPEPDAALTEHAAVVDVSDGWVAVTLEGAAGPEVMARLVPVDLRPAQFAQGHSVRTQIFHMTGSITRTGPETLLILVFRSMAATLVHDIERAMAAVASRG